LKITGITKGLGKQPANHNPLKLNNFGCARHCSSKLGSALVFTKFAVEPYLSMLFNQL